MPVVATNALTIATDAARSAARANNSVHAKDSNDKSFFNLLTEQTAPEKTESSSKGNSQTHSGQVGTKSSGTAPSTKTKAPHVRAADGKAAGKKTNSVKQNQHDAKKDPADTDTKIVSNRADKSASVSEKDADSDSADADQSGNDAGNQTRSGSDHDDAGKDAVAADVPVPTAPDLSAPPPPPIQQANTDAMAQAATASAQTPTVQTSAPALPSGQDIAMGGIGAGRPRSRLPEVPPQQANISSSPTAPETDSDSDPATANASTTASVSAAAAQTIQATTVSVANSQDDSDADEDDAPDAMLGATPGAKPQSAADAQSPITIAPPPAPPSRSGAATPYAQTAQNNKSATPGTEAPTPASLTASSKDNQPLNADDAVQTTRPNAPQPLKTAESGFKLTVAKNSDPQGIDAPARAAADSNAPVTAAPQPVQPPTLGPVNPMIALADAGAGTPQAISGNSAPAATASIHVGPQTGDVSPNVNGLAVEIAAKSQSGAKQFDIRLDPPELGRVEVRLSIDASGKAEAHMTADQPQTLHLLQKDSDTLTRALRDAGLDVSQDGLNFSLRGQDRQNGQDQNNSRGGAASRALQATKIIEAMPVSTITYSGTGNTRLDIHV